MTVDLNQCDQSCFGCIRSYKSKHNLRQGQKFQIACNGIPKDFIPASVLATIRPDERDTALAMLDPVTWAAKTMDWHCFDADGEIWKRKNPTEYWEWVEANPDTPIEGHSRYHRPYQGEMLRCTAKDKAFRIGRQAGKTETLVISMLFNLFTKPGVPDDEGFEIIVITPYQSQIDLIFTRMKELIHAAKLSTKRDVKAPIYTIELYNGSKVKGFTAGTKSGGNAEAVRGQHGNMLVFDEADYLNAGDMDAAMSIITNYPNATVWMSSTPSGKRERFFENCNSKMYKEFHYPSSVNPLWNDNLEAKFRQQLTEIGYIHEIDAKFGEQEQGVFQNAYVQTAKANYEYGSIAPEHSWIYTIGVDWNSPKHGTTINVLGFNPRKQQFIIVDRCSVSRAEWTQMKAMEKIVEYNRIWRPMSIYVDRGFGSTQIEVLHKYGYDALSNPTKGPAHPDSKLRDIVKAYDFGSSIETRDLFTQQPLKKQAKGFLVESTVRRFESGDIKFPETDEALEAQLLGYVIDRITPTGNAVYKAGNVSAGDHALDALMLSVVAFVLEATPFGQVKFDTNIAFSGQFGEKTTAAMIQEGDFVVQRKNTENDKKRRERSKPSNRDVNKQQSLFPSNQDLPGANMRRKNETSLWSWEGFNSDQPAPKIRTVGEAADDATNRTGYRPGNRGGRPRRKNI